jgi:crotonobetainyl-CoA:carnitine CoA-transferase CaiB-like acyl-CoA transferase
MTRPDARPGQTAPVLAPPDEGPDDQGSSDLPLAGLLVVDLSQFLSGPYCSLRLADLGARVIKVERPDGGDLTRRLYLSDTDLGGDSTLFHAINRGKESLALDLKDEGDVARLMRLVARADVVVQNFRPGVAERLGVGAAQLRAVNPRLVVAQVSGWGAPGEWEARPGQDLLAQARSGVMWLTGNAGDGPVPMGLAVADILAGAALVQGVLAALVRRGVTGRGALVETSLLEALLDLQFEVLTTHLNDGGRPPLRAAARGAHAYLAAPYGVYRARDGWIALAMTPLARLGGLLGLEGRPGWDAGADGFAARDGLGAVIAERIAEGTVAAWLAILEPADIWCAEVLDWPRLMESATFRALGIVQEVTRGDGVALCTLRAPLRIDGVRLPGNGAAAPQVGADSARLRAEFGL